jgi:hypothetical protein
MTKQATSLPAANRCQEAVALLWAIAFLTTVKRRGSKRELKSTT